jgi:hypothetical protein
MSLSRLNKEKNTIVGADNKIFAFVEEFLLLLLHLKVNLGFI